MRRFWPRGLAVAARGPTLTADRKEQQEAARGRSGPHAGGSGQGHDSPARLGGAHRIFPLAFQAGATIYQRRSGCGREAGPPGAGIRRGHPPVSSLSPTTWDERGNTGAGASALPRRNGSHTGPRMAGSPVRRPCVDRRAAGRLWRKHADRRLGAACEDSGFGGGPSGLRGSMLTSDCRVPDSSTVVGRWRRCSDVRLGSRGKCLRGCKGGLGAGLVLCKAMG